MQSIENPFCERIFSIPKLECNLNLFKFSKILQMLLISLKSSKRNIARFSCFTLLWINQNTSPWRNRNFTFLCQLLISYYNIKVIKLEMTKWINISKWRSKCFTVFCQKSIILQLLKDYSFFFFKTATSFCNILYINLSLCYNSTVSSVQTASSSLLQEKSLSLIISL